MRFAKLILLWILLIASQLPGESGKIAFIIGSVDIQRSGTEEWQTAIINAEVGNGDRIRTRLQSRCEIALPDESKIQIEENTVFEVKILDEDKEDQEEYSFFLWLGNIRAKFEKLVTARQERRIESPSAVVAVRGTEFSLGVDPTRRTSVKVFSGSVEFTSTSTGGSVMVGANQSSSVNPGENPTPPRTDPDDQGGGDAGDQGGEGDEGASNLNLQIDLNKFVYTEPSVRNQGIRIPGNTRPGAQVKAAGAVAMANESGDFILTVPVDEGLNSITVNAVEGGESVSATLRVYINTEPPRFTVKRPVNSRFVNLSQYDLEGAINDATPDDRIELFINDSKIGQYNGKSNFRVPIVLKEGLNELKIVAMDRNGNSFEQTESLYLDSIKPQIVVNKPATSGLVLRQPPNPPTVRARPVTYVVTGRILDPQPSSGLERVTVNGVSIQLAPNGQFELPIQLRLGSNEIVFIARDRAGNEQRTTRNIQVLRGNQ